LEASFFGGAFLKGQKAVGCFLITSLGPRGAPTVIGSTCWLKINTGYC